MPELPEVETVRRGLLATVLGRRVESVEVLSRQSLAAPRRAFEGLLVGHWLAAVARAERSSSSIWTAMRICGCT